MEGETRRLVVVDASVVAKWFLEEEYSVEARLLRDAYVEGLIDLAAPELLPFEVLNALRYSRAYSPGELVEAARALTDFQIALYRLEGRYAERTVELAVEKGITVYDASYVALAAELGTVLYTADEKLLARTRDLGLVRHIAEYRV